MVRARTWAAVAFASVLFSAGAVAVVASHASNPLAAHLWRAAERFAAPGELLWWATLGGAFSGYPSGPAGYAIWILGTALFWFAVVVAFVVLVRRLRTRN